MTTNDMTTFRQFLEARELSEALMMKYSQEASQGRRTLYGDEQVDEAFRDVAAALGYRVERIAAPAVTEVA